MVPELQLGEDKKPIYAKWQVPLKVNGKEAVVEMRKLSTGERNAIRSKCTQTRIIGGQDSTTFNSTEFQELILEKCIVEAPFSTSLKDIKELPVEVTDYLFDEWKKRSEPTDEKKDE